MRVLLIFLSTLIACSKSNPLIFKGEERYFASLKQLTFGGENAEAYFSFDGKKLIFQSTRDTFKCDQIFTMDTEGRSLRLISTGKGRTTCAYFFPDNKKALFSSTHHISSECPEIKRPPVHRYAWSILPYDIFSADVDGKNLKQLTQNPEYDAEATISKDGKVVFTSLRDGDIGIYLMDLDGKNIRKLINRPGYEGGPFFSSDGSKVVFRAFYPETPEEEEEYKKLLKMGFISPLYMEIFVIDSSGENLSQVTRNRKVNFAPFWHPSGEYIIFSSNMDDPEGRNFELYIIKPDGSGLKRVTFYEGFDSFPMFSPDGKKLVFASNRGGKTPHETNIFIVDWTWVGSVR